MQTFYHKNSVIDAVKEWAEKTEHKAEMARVTAESDGVIKAALILGQAVSQTIDGLNFAKKSNSPVKSNPLTIGSLNNHYNSGNELTHQSESCQTHSEAICVQSGWPDGKVKQYFRIAHDHESGEYLFAKADKKNEIVDGNKIKVLKDKSALTAHLHQALPSFI
tara:strand:- start:83 stop:574 length:492 start_codon:yes stop_codon:yes gene_type:complete